MMLTLYYWLLMARWVRDVVFSLSETHNSFFLYQGYSIYTIEIVGEKERRIRHNQGARTPFLASGRKLYFWC